MINIHLKHVLCGCRDGWETQLKASELVRKSIAVVQVKHDGSLGAEV